MLVVRGPGFQWNNAKILLHQKLTFLKPVNDTSKHCSQEQQSQYVDMKCLQWIHKNSDHGGYVNIILFQSQKLKDTKETQQS